MVSSNLDLAHCIELDIALFWKVLSVMKLYSAVIIKRHDSSQCFTVSGRNNFSDTLTARVM